MAIKTKGRGTIQRGLPVLLKVIALCVIALVALLLMLPEPPDLPSGGVTKVAKHVPTPHDTVNPLGNEPTPRVATRLPEPAERPAAQLPREPITKIARTPEPAPSPLQTPLHKPENPGEPDSRPSSGTPALPRDLDRETARLSEESAARDQAGTGGVGLPGKSDIRDWLRSQAWEFLGGVDPQGNILYRFEVWLDAPPNMLNGVKSVSYVYDAPSATPREREIDNAKTGFRARFGSLACSKNVEITLTMEDGRKQRAVADGCRALN